MQRCIEVSSRAHDTIVRKYGLMYMGPEAGANKALNLANFNSNVLRACRDKVRSGQAAWLMELRGATKEAEFLKRLKERCNISRWP